MKQTQPEQLIGYLELLRFIKNHKTSCFDVRHCCFNEISRLGLVLYPKIWLPKAQWLKNAAKR